MHMFKTAFTMNASTVPILNETLKSFAGNFTFSWYDYAFFSGMLSISALIGIYFGCFGSKQSTANEYLMGGRSMGVIPVSLSLTAR